MLADGVVESVAVEVGVDLCCCEAGVAEHFLDDAEVGAAGHEVGGEAVAEHVGVDALEAGAGGPSADDDPDGGALEGAAGA